MSLIFSNGMILNPGSGGGSANFGRFLSLWNATTGLPDTEPTTLPYEYKTGDYYIIGTIAAEGGTNYKPDGLTYTGDASTVVETEDIAVNDFYFFDGNAWKLLINTKKDVSFGSIVGSPYDNDNLAEALNSKSAVVFKRW